MQPLVQVTAHRNVDLLHSPAYAEQGQAVRKGRPDERNRDGVAGVIREANHLDGRIAARSAPDSDVARRTGEDEAVERVSECGERGGILRNLR